MVWNTFIPGGKWKYEKDVVLFATGLVDNFCSVVVLHKSLRGSSHRAGNLWQILNKNLGLVSVGGNVDLENEFILYFKNISWA